MKKIYIFSVVVLLPFLLLAQIGKRLTNKTINIATTINYYPELEPYSYFSTFGTEEQDEITLTFLRENAGTFVIEEGQSLRVKKTSTRQIPSQLLGIGANIQIFSADGLFQELSLTKLSFSKSTYRDEYLITDDLGMLQSLIDGYDERTAAFAMRYEVGKFFRKKRRRKGPFHFGLAGAIEPSLYTYRRTPLGSANFPLSAKMFTVELAVVSTLSTKISKKLRLDFKLIPNVLFADYGSFKIKNPLLTEEQQKGELNYSLPELNLAFSVLLRYQIQERDKRRGRG